MIINKQDLYLARAFELLYLFRALNIQTLNEGIAQIKSIDKPKYYDVNLFIKGFKNGTNKIPFFLNLKLNVLLNSANLENYSLGMYIFGQVFRQLLDHGYDKCCEYLQGKRA